MSLFNPDIWKWPWEESDVDDRVYQREDGTMYIESDEFARSKEGRKLLKRFSENVGVSE